jgi:NhaP-type Na+/H+ or K+/H+ antiporter
MDPLSALALILGLGIGTQWLAWRLRMPSILLLLLAGLLVGPLTGVLDPDALFGRFLSPVIGLSVAIIVFEGGLGLRFSELGAHGRVVARLVTSGVIVTAAVGAAAAAFFLGLPFDLAILLGIILSVSGPTVVLPLLRTVGAKRDVEAILRWEGILIDPIGALLAVLAFEAISHAGAEGIVQVFTGLIGTIVIGGFIGLAAAMILMTVESRYWLPDHLVGAVGLGLVVLTFAAAEMVSDEGGLMAVTVMGVVLANQKKADIRHIVDFKENLSQVLLGSLFILLAARIGPADLRALEAGMIPFIAALVFIGRPLAVLVATKGSELGWKQRGFLAWLAPRGIVAAAVSAFFGLRLEEAGRPEGALFVPITFLVIVSTVTLYGLTARPLARALGVAGPKATGVLFVGASRGSRELARVLEDEGFPTLLVDSNREALSAAKTDGLNAMQADPMDVNFDAQVDLSRYSRLWAMTANDSQNHLVCVHYAPEFGRAKVYHIEIEEHHEHPAGHETVGRRLFANTVTYRSLRDRLASGWAIRRTPITEHFDHAAWRKQHGAEAEPLFLITADRRLEIFTSNHQPPVTAGKTMVALTPPTAELAEELEEE